MSNVENLSPQIIRQVVKELQGLQTNALEGIKVLINDADVTDIQAIIEGPAGTPYANGAFRIKLTLPKDFPSHPPKAFFLTRIFHPNVAPNGEICVNTLKKDWKSDLGIQHILLVSSRPALSFLLVLLIHVFSPNRPSNVFSLYLIPSLPSTRKLANSY